MDGDVEFHSIKSEVRIYVESFDALAFYLQAPSACSLFSFWGPFNEP